MSKAKKASLSAALHDKTKTAEPVAVQPAKSPKPPKGQGDDLVQFNMRLPRDAKTQLDYLKLELGAPSIHAMMLEALDDFFQKHKKKRIAQ